ncbi:histidine kinase [Methylobacterium radiodurans]|uniref:Histidine kinase n=1 Tax=Methylobacterium radiodurans TaxID=2202828 RepID=A0A2U8VLT7_9HYPH|nr:histidine kinase [Methylobacterium radiodurans]AWN34625.1 histidine kinase [Methylobacterium radiodurans]
MADYYPLLARALDALPDRTPAMRRAVYDRARNALVAQLRSIDPPLSEDDIDTERRALDSAITRLEATYDVPAAANDPAPKAAAEPGPSVSAPRPPEASPVPPPQTVAPVPTQPVPAPPPPPPVPEPAAPAFAEAAPPEHPAEPFLPPAPPPHFVPAPPEPPREPAIPIAPPRPASEAPPPPDAEPAPEPAAAPEPAVPPDAQNGRQRPRIDVVAPRNRSRLLRNAFVGVVLACVIGAIAVAAYLLRDRPTELQATAPGPAETQAEGGDAKFADRLGGEPAPAERPGASETRAPAQGATQGTAPAPAQPDLAVAQRATLLEEGSGGPDAQPVTNQGRVLWRLESVSGEQGQPLQTAVVATITVPDALTLTLTIQRNLDATLPASHTVSLAFSPSGPDAAKRTVQDIGLLQAKDEESARGSPLSGLPVRVRENLFLIGLSSLRNDVDRNTDLLLHRNWFDLGLRYANGQRAVVTFEKGNTGAQVLQRAFEQWR